MSRSDGGVEKDRKSLFILLNSEKNEPRSSGGYRAIRLVATVAVGGCGTRSAQTVLALFPPSSLRLHRPIKAESGALACILTPSPYGHSPYILLRKTQGERIKSDTSNGLCGLPLFFVETLLVAPKLPVILRDTAG